MINMLNRISLLIIAIALLYMCTGCTILKCTAGREGGKPNKADLRKVENDGDLLYDFSSLKFVDDKITGENNE